MVSPTEGGPPQVGESIPESTGDSPGLDVSPGLDASPDYGHLSEFTLDLAKAMLRTGYYSPEHPQSKQSLAGLHDELRGVLGELPGITYLVQMEGEDRTILIEGYAEVPLALNDIMIRGMSELFEPKLIDFFNRRRLKSFSLRPRIEVDEFNAFVILMSEPPRAGRAREERERVAQALVDQNIIQVSTVFEADLLGEERRIPWRVQLAISRLGRDLRMLPLYKNTTPEEMQEIKIQILDEVIRPMRTPELLRDLLVNCDLLARDITVLKEIQVEREILRLVPRPLLIPAAWEIMLDVEDLEDGEESEEGAYLERLTRRRLLLRDILEELISDEQPIESELLEAMIERDVCALKELPKELRRQVKRHRFIDIFLEREKDYLKAFRSMPPGEKGKELAKVAQHVFPELLHRGKYPDAEAVLVAVTTGGRREGEGETVAKLLKSIRQSVRDDDMIDRLIGALGDEDLDRIDRDAVVAILSLAGKRAASELRELYANTTSQAVRGSAFDAMRGIGRPALEKFLTDLADGEEEWPVIHHILGALGDQTDPALAEPIKRFLNHENGRVRHVALTRVFEILGGGAEEVLIRALDDPDVVTRQAAVAYLGQLQSRHPRVRDFYVAALGSEAPKSGSSQPEEVLGEVCRSLASLGDASLRDDMGPEDLLLDGLVKGGKKGLLGKFKKRTAQHSEKVKVAICEALGSVGTEVGAEVLADLTSDESPELTEAATVALEAIRSR